ncbi:hypothetical protein BDB00DRAFT_784922 [Zychaea mexicana]|uniref:uncharacterized protein n=1 Tax=Zychaea mexicana TaxID=64656 RepID=UPI0022FEB7C5|nr:uncharacterized protein BDB00DRAFT_784922 [Zychaea mexicana]KAI9497185.1 hypothetical protein BDB00DRAFT_784922 [Zychaea mexicana]
MYHSATDTTSAPSAPPFAYDNPPQYHNNNSSSGNSNPPTLARVIDALSDCQRVIVDQRNTFQRLITEGRKAIAQKTLQHEELQYQSQLLKAENATLLEQVKEKVQQGNRSIQDNINASKTVFGFHNLVVNAVDPSTTKAVSDSLGTTTVQEGAPLIDIKDIERQLKIQQHENVTTTADLVEARMQLATAEKRLTECLNDNVSCKMQSRVSEAELRETIWQNESLFDELQVTRQNEDQLIERCFQLEEQLQKYVLRDRDRLKLVDDDVDCLNGASQQQRSVLQPNDRNHRTTTTATTAAIGADGNYEDSEEWVQLQRAPHYEVLVNDKVTSEAIVANNASVSFIKEDVVRRAGMMPKKLSPSARFKCWGSNHQPMIVVKEAVVVPIKIGAHRGRCPMFVYQQIGSDIILGASWLKSEHAYWMVNHMLIGPKKLRVDPKPPVMVRKTDPKAQVSVDNGPVIIERLN